MANELKHGSVGTELTQAEWEAVGAHVFSSQAAGDIMYASSTSQLSRLAKGADNTVLHLASGIPAWSATLAGLTLTTPTISSTGFANATHAHAASNSGGTVAASALSGTSLASGVVTTSATTVGVLNAGSISTGFGTIDVGGSSIAGGSFDASDGNITNVGDVSLDSLSSDGDTITITPTTDTIFANGTGLIVGHTALQSMVITPEFQILGTGQNDGGLGQGQWSNDANGPLHMFTKSRNTTIGSHTIVQDNDKVGVLIFAPDDGSDYDTLAADFGAEVDDGSPATGDIGMAFAWRQMPGGGGGGARETLRLAADGNLLIANDGGFVVGHTAQVGMVITPELQVLGTAQNDGAIGQAQWSNDNNGPLHVFMKSRNATIGSHTIVADNDNIGSLLWAADDGVDYDTLVAEFRLEVDDGSPGAGDIGTAFVFKQMPGGGGGGHRETMRIAADGGIFFPLIGAASAGTAVSITSNELHTDTSSERYKDNIGSLDIDSGLIYELNTRSFDWNDSSGSAGQHDFGLIAEEVAEVLPGLVNYDDDSKPFSLRNSLLPHLIVEELKKLRAKIAVLEGV